MWVYLIQKTAQICVDMVGAGLAFSSLLYAFYWGVLWMFKVIQSHIFHSGILLVLVYGLFQVRAFDTVTAKIKLDTCRLHAARGRQMDTDYAMLATLLEQSQVKLVHTDPAAVEAHIKYNDHVLSVLTEALKPDTPTLKKIYMALATKLIQHAFKTYTNGTILDIEPDIKVSWPEVFQIWKEKGEVYICEFVWSLGVFCFRDTV